MGAVSVYNESTIWSDNYRVFKPVLAVFSSMAMERVFDCLGWRGIENIDELDARGCELLRKNFPFIAYCYQKRIFFNDRDRAQEVRVRHVEKFRGLIRLLNDFRMSNGSFYGYDYGVSYGVKRLFSVVFHKRADVLCIGNRGAKMYRRIDRRMISPGLFEGDMFSLTGGMFFLSAFISDWMCVALYENVARVAVRLYDLKHPDYAGVSSEGKKRMLYFFDNSEAYRLFSAQKGANVAKGKKKGKKGKKEGVGVEDEIVTKCLSVGLLPCGGEAGDVAVDLGSELVAREERRRRVDDYLRVYEDLDEENEGAAVVAVVAVDRGDRLFRMIAVDFLRGEFGDIGVSWGKMVLVDGQLRCLCRIRFWGDTVVVAVGADLMRCVLKYAFSQESVEEGLMRVFELLFMRAKGLERGDELERCEDDMRYEDVRGAVVYNMMLNDLFVCEGDEDKVRYVIGTLMKMMRCGEGELAAEADADFLTMLRRYREVSRLLHLMLNPAVASEACFSLIELFESDMGSYRRFIDRHVSLSGMKDMEDRMFGVSTLSGWFDLCVEYQRLALDRFNKMSEVKRDFDVSQWRKGAELAWLGLPRAFGAECRTLYAKRGLLSPTLWKWIDRNVYDEEYCRGLNCDIVRAIGEFYDSGQRVLRCETGVDDCRIDDEAVATSIRCERDVEGKVRFFNLAGDDEFVVEIVPKNKNIRREIEVRMVVHAARRSDTSIWSHDLIQLIFNSLKGSGVIAGDSITIPYLNYDKVMVVDLTDEQKRVVFPNMNSKAELNDKILEMNDKYVLIQNDGNWSKCLRYHISHYEVTLFQFVYILLGFERRVIEKYPVLQEKRRRSFDDIVEVLTSDNENNIPIIETIRRFRNCAFNYKFPSGDLDLKRGELDYFKVGKEAIMSYEL